MSALPLSVTRIASPSWRHVAANACSEISLMAAGGVIMAGAADSIALARAARVDESRADDERTNDAAPAGSGLFSLLLEQSTQGCQRIEPEQRSDVLACELR